MMYLFHAFFIVLASCLSSFTAPTTHLSQQPSVLSNNKYNLPSNYKNISRIVVIADIHDDMQRFKTILKNANILDKKDDWVAINTIVVQLGDQIDKKSTDQDIDNKHHFRMTRYTEYLKHLAQNKGSNFISLIGNHELMNIEKIRKREDLKNIISRRPIVFITNNYLFCHGGFHTEHLNMLYNYGKNLKDLNKIWYKYVNELPLHNNEIELLNALILNSQDSILYSRKIADDYEVFEYLDLDYMFVGHTTTTSIFVKNRVWHLDQLLSYAFNNKNYNYIDITDGKITIKNIQNYLE